MLAYLTNAEGSIIIAIVFLSLAAAVIVLSLRTRHQRRGGGVQREPTLLERVEAMTNEEYDAWRAEGQRQRQAALKTRRERRSGQGGPGQ